MFTKSTLTVLLLATISLSFNASQCAAQDIDLDDGVLTITGTDMDDFSAVWAEWDSDDLIVVLRVKDEDGNVIVEMEEDYDSDRVDLVVFHGFDGDDDFENDLEWIPCVAYGGEGDDYLCGGYEEDALYGGPGDDSLGGSHGDDRLFGGPGKDDLNGHQGNDYLKAGAGEDEGFIRGGNGLDTFVMPLEYNYRIGKWSSVQVNMEYFDYNWREDKKEYFHLSAPTTSKTYTFSSSQLSR